MRWNDYSPFYVFHVTKYAHKYARPRTKVLWQIFSIAILFLVLFLEKLNDSLDDFSNEIHDRVWQWVVRDIIIIIFLNATIAKMVKNTDL